MEPVNIYSNATTLISYSLEGHVNLSISNLRQKNIERWPELYEMIEPFPILSEYPLGTLIFSWKPGSTDTIITNGDARIGLEKKEIKIEKGQFLVDNKKFDSLPELIEHLKRETFYFESFHVGNYDYNYSDFISIYSSNPSNGLALAWNELVKCSSMNCIEIRGFTQEDAPINSQIKSLPLERLLAITGENRLMDIILTDSPCNEILFKRIGFLVWQASLNSCDVLQWVLESCRDYLSTHTELLLNVFRESVRQEKFDVALQLAMFSPVIFLSCADDEIKSFCTNLSKICGGSLYIGSYSFSDTLGVFRFLSFFTDKDSLIGFVDNISKSLSDNDKVIIFSEIIDCVLTGRLPTYLLTESLCNAYLVYFLSDLDNTSKRLLFQNYLIEPLLFLFTNVNWLQDPISDFTRAFYASLALQINEFNAAKNILRIDLQESSDVTKSHVQFLLDPHMSFRIGSKEYFNMQKCLLEKINEKEKTPFLKDMLGILFKTGNVLGAQFLLSLAPNLLDPEEIGELLYLALDAGSIPLLEEIEKTLPGEIFKYLPSICKKSLELNNREFLRYFFVNKGCKVPEIDFNTMGNKKFLSCWKLLTPEKKLFEVLGFGETEELLDANKLKDENSVLKIKLFFWELFLNSDLQDVLDYLQEYESAIKEKYRESSEIWASLKRVIDEVKSEFNHQGALISRFPSPDQQHDMFLIYGEHRGFKSYTEQQIAYSEEREQIVQETVNEIVKCDLSLKEVYNKLISGRKDNEDQMFKNYRYLTLITHLYGRYKRYQHLFLNHIHSQNRRSIKDKEFPRGFSAQIESKGAQNQRLILSKLVYGASKFFKTTERSINCEEKSERFHTKHYLDNETYLIHIPSWLHTDPKHIAPAMAEASKLFEEIKKMHVDPNDTLRFRYKVARLYHLLSHATPTNRGNAQYVLEIHNTIPRK